MSKPLKIALIILAVIIVLALVGLAIIAYWSRPGRLSESVCRDLVRKAWQTTNEGALTGDREFIYRLGNREYRVRTDPEEEDRFPQHHNAIAEMFTQAEPDDEFFSRLKIEHAGRIRIAGKICERIRLSPKEYEGDSLMLWIDPEAGYMLSWRRFDTHRHLIRGFTYERVDYHAAVEPGIPVEDMPGDPVMQFLGDPQLLTEEELVVMAADRPVALPSWLPPGFDLRGGRIVNSLEPPGGFEGVFPGMGFGRLRRGAGNLTGPFQGIGQGQLQLIYSDGMNTVTLVQFEPQRVIGQGLDPGHVQATLDAKALEVERVFHVTMAAKVFPGAIVILFGGVAPDVLRQVADSIPEPEIPQGLGAPPFMGPPDGSTEGPWYDRPGRGGGSGRRGGGGFGPGPGGGNPPPDNGPE